jgi:hypothetical protein
LSLERSLTSPLLRFLEYVATFLDNEVDVVGVIVIVTLSAFPSRSKDTLGKETSRDWRLSTVFSVKPIELSLSGLWSRSTEVVSEVSWTPGAEEYVGQEIADLDAVTTGCESVHGVVSVLWSMTLLSIF